MWSPSNSEWKFGHFFATVRTANYFYQMLSAVAGHCSYQYHFTLVYLQCPPYFILCTKGKCKELAGCTRPPSHSCIFLLLLSSLLPIFYLLYFDFPISFLFFTSFQVKPLLWWQWSRNIWSLFLVWLPAQIPIWEGIKTKNNEEEVCVKSQWLLSIWIRLWCLLVFHTALFLYWVRARNEAQ